MPEADTADAAVHEAGHILVASWFGVQVLYADMRFGERGDAVTRFHWGEVSTAAKAIYNGEANALLSDDRRVAYDIAPQVLEVAVAGFCAEAVCESGEKTELRAALKDPDTALAESAESWSRQLDHGQLVKLVKLVAPPWNSWVISGQLRP